MNAGVLSWVLCSDVHGKNSQLKFRKSRTHIIYVDRHVPRNISEVHNFALLQFIVNVSLQSSAKSRSQADKHRHNIDSKRTEDLFVISKVSGYILQGYMSCLQV